MSGGGEASGVTGEQEVVGAVSLGLGGDGYGGSGGGTGGGGGGDGGYDNKYGQLIRLYDNASNVILGIEHNCPLDYDPGLELHHPIMSILGGNGHHLYIERYALAYLGWLNTYLIV